MRAGKRALRNGDRTTGGDVVETVQGGPREVSGAFAAFTRFVLCGGGVGVASSFAVAALASWTPWALANAVTTAVSTLLATELHARFTFGAGGHATGRQHAVGESELTVDARPGVSGGRGQRVPCGSRPWPSRSSCMST